jgi:outer membrane biosynthesis protein TonB
MINELALEREHKRKSTRISFFFHLGLLILAFMVKCNYEKANENQYAVAINFEEIEFKPSANSNTSTSTSGEPRKKADPVTELEEAKTPPIEVTKPEVKVPTPTPTPPTPTDPVISETTMEDSEVEAVEEEIEFDDPEPEPVPDPEPAPKEPPQETTKDKISKILDIFKSGGGKKTDNPNGESSREEGTDKGTGEGKTGTGKGADKTGDDGDSGVGTGGAGKGEYDDSGNGVFGRKVIYRNIGQILKVGFENQENKRIVAKICVNRAGHVSYVEILNKETTAVIPSGKMKEVLNGMYGYKYEPDPRAPKEQCGKLSIILQNIKALAPEE